MKKIGLIFGLLLVLNVQAQLFNHHDSVLGSVNSNRSWWNVLKYELSVDFDLKSKSISGTSKIIFKPLATSNWMQIDLKHPLEVAYVTFKNQSLTFKRERDYFLVDVSKLVFSNQDTITVGFQGQPAIAKRAPWDGGFTYSKDAKGRPMVSVACQGLGASAWWPNKDHVYDEPEQGVHCIFTIDKQLDCVSNGRKLKEYVKGKKKTVEYQTNSSINNYNITFYIGHYVHVKDTYEGLKGTLDIEYVVLDYNQEKAITHLQKDTKDMLNAFEKWFGPYPFYQDGYRLVETNYLGMEHQSAIAYGNHFKKGYEGWDRSMSGYGMSWDYIIVHESGHEWWGNQVSCNDVADLWIHESFTTYSEVLFVEEMQGKEQALAYLKGLRKNINNHSPIIGVYGMNQEGSGDMYDKGAQIVAMIRAMMNNDALFRQMLRAIQKEYSMQTISSKTIEEYIKDYSGLDLTTFFDQYLRNEKIPMLKYSFDPAKGFVYWVEKTVPNFRMDVLGILNGQKVRLTIKPEKQVLPVLEKESSFRLDDYFYLKTMQVNPE